MRWAVLFVALFVVPAVSAQADDVTAAFDLAATVERIGIVAVLAIGLVVVWRSYALQVERLQKENDRLWDFFTRRAPI